MSYQPFFSCGGTSDLYVYQVGKTTMTSKGAEHVNRVVAILKQLEVLANVMNVPLSPGATPPQPPTNRTSSALHKYAIKLQYDVLQPVVMALAKKLSLRHTVHARVALEHLFALTGEPLNSSMDMLDGSMIDPSRATGDDVKVLAQGAKNVADAILVQNRSFMGAWDELYSDSKKTLLKVLHDIRNRDVRDEIETAIAKAARPLRLDSVVDVEIARLVNMLHSFRSFIEYESI